MTELVHITYEPLRLARLVLDIFLEEQYDRNEDYPKSTRYAVNEYTRTMSDEELEDILDAYVTQDNVEAITFADDTDCERITHFILKTRRYKDLVIGYQTAGFDGLGVFDRIKEKFYPCEFSEHWGTLGNILKDEYGNYGEAFDEIMHKVKKEHNGITDEELNRFIFENFLFVGSQRSPQEGD